jgi:hypothetical protein
VVMGMLAGLVMVSTRAAAPLLRRRAVVHCPWTTSR